MVCSVFDTTRSYRRGFLQTTREQFDIGDDGGSAFFDTALIQDTDLGQVDWVGGGFGKTRNGFRSSHKHVCVELGRENRAENRPGWHRFTTTQFCRDDESIATAADCTI